MENDFVKIVINCETGEETLVNLTAEETAEREALAEQVAKETAEQEAIAAEAKAKREALLARLGITEEEASLLAQSL